MTLSQTKKKKSWRSKLLNNFPDVLGMELCEASALLESEGLTFIIVETKPTKKQAEEGVLRVIRRQIENNSLRLTVCRI